MNFILNDFHRNVSDDDLLADLIRVSSLIDNEHLSRDLYKKYGKYGTSTFERRFGTWSKALLQAGLLCNVVASKNANNINVSNEQLLEDLKRVAQKLSLDTITTTQYDTYGNHGHIIIISRFKKWENALIAAELKPTGYHHKVSREELLEEIERIWVKLGRQPTSTDIVNGISIYSLNSYSRKFGSWRNALISFIEYINMDDNSEKENSKEAISATIKPKEKHEQTRTTKRDINLRLRFKVMKRDNFKCCLCGRSPATTPGLELQIDHIKPWAKGGETTLDNLQTLCRNCNLGKSDLE